MEGYKIMRPNCTMRTEDITTIPPTSDIYLLGLGNIKSNVKYFKSFILIYKMFHTLRSRNLKLDM